MVRIFRHYIPGSLLLLALVEHLTLITAIYVALFLRWADAENITTSLAAHFAEAVTFATVFSLMMMAFGLYHKDICYRLGMIMSRLLLSFAVGFLLLTLLFYVYPSLALWRSAFAIAFVLGFVGIMGLRWLYRSLANVETFKRRILVLGVGQKAARIAELERSSSNHSFTCAGFVPFDDREYKVEAGRNIWGSMSLPELARDEGIEEIVVALDERRGHLPVSELLNCKFTGVDVSDYTTFWERETGRVDLDSLNPSWLIFSDGFVGGRLQSMMKRAFDLGASLLLLVLSLPILIIAAIAVKLGSAGPVFYRQERVGLNGKPFQLLKFRSMRVDAESDGVPRWADVKDSRITRVGAIMRRTRIDEIPQIFNVIRGDMSFVGPRPERPFFVERLRGAIPYYFERHRVKPGIAGWAQLNYPYGASVEDAKQKFQYDLYYIKNYSVFLDLLVLLQTARVILWSHGAR